MGLRESCMRENRTCSLSGGRRPASRLCLAPPPTRLRVSGRWMYLFRAVDDRGQTVDFYLSETRDTPRQSCFCSVRWPIPTTALRMCSRPMAIAAIQRQSGSCRRKMLSTATAIIAFAGTVITGSNPITVTSNVVCRQCKVRGRNTRRGQSFRELKRCR